MKLFIMLSINEIRKGDYVLANNLGDIREGEVYDISRSHRMICVADENNRYWYNLADILDIPLDESQLFRLQFHKTVNTDGTVKYSKGAFRILIEHDGDYSKLILWYRNEYRHIFHPISVHVLQNHFLQMTKVYLDDSPYE